MELVFLLGLAENEAAASALIVQTPRRKQGVDLAEVKQHWTDLVVAVQIISPDRTVDIKLNG